MTVMIEQEKNVLIEVDKLNGSDLDWAVGKVPGRVVDFLSDGSVLMLDRLAVTLSLFVDLPYPPGLVDEQDLVCCDPKAR